MASSRHILLLIASCFCLSALAKRESEDSSAAAAAAVEQTVREHSAAQAEAAASAESYAGIGVFASGQLEVARTVNAALKRKFFGGSATPAPQPPPDDVGGGDQQSQDTPQQTPPNGANQNQNAQQQPQSRQGPDSTQQTQASGGTPPPAPAPTCNLQSEPATCDGVKSQRKGWWGRTFGKSNEQQRLIEKTHKLCTEHAKYRKEAVKAEKDMKEYKEKLETATKLFESLREDLIENEASIAKQGQTLDEIVAAANKHGVLMQKMQQMKQTLNGPAENKENTDPQDHQ